MIKLLSLVLSLAILAGGGATVASLSNSRSVVYANSQNITNSIDSSDLFLSAHGNMDLN